MKPEELSNIVKPIIKGMVRSARQNDYSTDNERWRIRFDLDLPTGEKIHVSAWCGPRFEDGSCIILLNATNELLDENLCANVNYADFKALVAKRCDLALQVWFEFYTDENGAPVNGKAADNFAILERYTQRLIPAA